MSEDIQALLVEYRRAGEAAEQALRKEQALAELLQDARDAMIGARKDLQEAERALLKSAWSGRRG